MFESIVLLCILRQLIYNYPEQLFAGAGVMAIEHADFAGVERLALVTGTQTHRCGSCGSLGWSELFVC